MNAGLQLSQRSSLLYPEDRHCPCDGPATRLHFVCVTYTQSYHFYLQPVLEDLLRSHCV